MSKPRPILRATAPLTLVAGRSVRDASDAQLAEALARGESWAIAEVWYRFAPMIWRMAERCLGSRTEAEDIAQEVFVRIYEKAGTLREPAALRSFIYSFAVRVLGTELRRRKRRSWLSFRPPEILADAMVTDFDAESREQLRRFYVLLDRLNPRDRLVFVLRRIESMTIDEIAQHMGLSTSTVKRSMLHAAKRLTVWVDADPELLTLLERGRSWS